MAMTLSDKVTTTIANLNLIGAAWQMPEIEWKKERRTVRGDVTCPECDGTRDCRYDAKGAAILFTGSRNKPGMCMDSEEWLEYRRAARADASHRPSGYGSCRRCTNGSSYSYGRVKGWVEKDVMVGYPIWLEGTKFDSRFGGCDCHACGKNGITSNRVPLYAVDAAGVPHAMWLGVDCATKFFQLTKEQKRLATKEGHLIAA